MNRIFKVVWNQALGTWMAVSELGNKNRKTKSSRTQKATLLAGALGMALAGAQAEEVTGEEIVDHGDRLEIRNLHQLKKHTDESGNETYESSGVFYNEKITGDTSLEISAPNVKYKKEKATGLLRDSNGELVRGDTETHVLDPNGEVLHKGEDDRYGRSVTLKSNSAEGNDYSGTTKINHGVSVHIGGTKEEDKGFNKNILGQSNDLDIEGYTSVMIHSTETVKNLTFKENNHQKIDRHVVWNGNQEDKDQSDVSHFYTLTENADYIPDDNGQYIWNGAWELYDSEVHGEGHTMYERVETKRLENRTNDPSGGSLFLDNKAHLIVEKETNFIGGDYNQGGFTLNMQVDQASFDLQGKAIFTDASLSLSRQSQGKTQEGISFTGHGAGVRVSNNSTLDVTGDFVAKTDDGARTFHYIERGSTATFNDNVVLENAELSISDGLYFSHNSRPAYEGEIADETQNKAVQGVGGADASQKSQVIAKNDITYSGAGSRLDIHGSSLTVEGNLTAQDQLSGTFLGATFAAKGKDKKVDLNNAQLVIGASDVDVADLKFGANSDVVIAGNQMALGALTLGENAKMTDATYRDGSEEGGRLAFTGDNSHHGLTYDEYVKVLAGKSSDSTEEVADDAELRYDIKRDAELIVSGDVTLEKGALYDAKGEVDINGGLNLKAEDTKFFVRGADAHVRADSLIHGEIGIDEEHSFNY